MIAAARAASSSTCRRRLFYPSIINPVKKRRITTQSFSTSINSNGSNSQQQQQQQYLPVDLEHAVQLVKRYDPAGYLPGQLLPSTEMKTAYFAIRSFWVETGLRIGSTARVQPNACPKDHLDWWQQSIDQLFMNNSNNDDEEEEETVLGAATSSPKLDWQTHSTLRLLHHVLDQTPDSVNDRFSVERKLSWTSKQHFDDVLQGRRNDLDLKQYPTLDHLERHASLSCASLSQLVLESGGMTLQTNPVAHQAARLVGMGHGLTNALRTSIPVVSTTGKLIVPEDLCVKYGVKTPRYLLSALGQGDTVALKALADAVQEIALAARSHLEAARELRDDILKEDKGDQAVKVLLPALASDTFLNRLEQSGYNLTDRDLRNVGSLEHMQCSLRMIWAYTQNKF